MQGILFLILTMGSCITALSPPAAITSSKDYESSNQIVSTTPAILEPRKDQTITITVSVITTQMITVEVTVVQTVSVLQSIVSISAGPTISVTNTVTSTVSQMSTLTSISVTSATATKPAAEAASGTPALEPKQQKWYQKESLHIFFAS